jgi:hypothetical protein
MTTTSSTRSVGWVWVVGLEVDDDDGWDWDVK